MRVYKMENCGEGTFPCLRHCVMNLAVTLFILDPVP